ncbi:MAG TPA: Rap1a/Tai family immunity protein [Caulobacteraceae bacterium]|jgi:hypothetical protein
MAKLLAVVLASGGLIAAAAPVSASDLEFFTGQSLYAQCSAKTGDPDVAQRQARCLGYVVGVSDAQQAAQGMGAAGRVCFPGTVNATQMVGAVAAFLEAHPEKRPLAAQDLVVEALAAQYPCK